MSRVLDNVCHQSRKFNVVVIRSISEMSPNVRLGQHTAAPPVSRNSASPPAGDPNSRKKLALVPPEANFSGGRENYVTPGQTLTCNEM